MVITEQQFFDYISCPAMYDLKYNHNIQLNEVPTIPKILEKVANYFYLYLLNNRKPPSLEQLSNKFESLAKPYLTYIPQNKYVDALFLVRNFYNWACSNKVVVIDPSARYTITHEGNILEGIMNPIAINKDKQFEYLIMNFSSRRPDQEDIDKKLKYTLDMYAYNQSSKDTRILATKIHHVKTGSDYTTSRNMLDNQRFLTAFNGVVKGIEAEAFYPRETNMCNQCPYKNYCRGWGANNEEVF